MIPHSNSITRMAIFSGNLMSRTAIQSQNQVLLIPWVKKKMKIGTICCSRRRNYSNSVPVRYIPKRSLENKESEEASSSPANGLDDVKMHTSLESNRNVVELSSSSAQTSYSSMSFVQDVKFRNRNGKPINSINYDVGLGSTGKVVQSNVQRLELSKSAETSCSSRGFDADTDFQNQNEKPLVGLDKSRVLGSNVETSELSNCAQTLCSNESFVVDSEFKQQDEKPINNLNEDAGLGTSRGVRSNVLRNELSQSAQTLYSNRSVIVNTEFQNGSEISINSIKHDVGLGTGRVVQSNVQRSELSKSVSSRRNSIVDTEFHNQHEKQFNSINNDVRLGTSRVRQSNVQRVELSNSTQTSSKSIVGDTEFQNQYKKRIDHDVGLGVGEELDGDMQYEGFEFMEELEGFPGEESNEGSLIQAVEVKEDVEKTAVELLATRAFTAVELRKKLLGKKFPLGVVDAVITDFQGRGLINDGLYAETFSRSRWSSSTWGPRRIKRALYSKGVSDLDAEKAIKSVFNGTAASGDQESGLGMSKLSMDHLLAQASKQWKRSCGVSREIRKARIVRWLQYRGFSWSITSFVLKKLESQYPS
ncbi:hypothetical protein ACH5RR_027731 [Cinchona calisaya]|uniref:Regulatory protein RecX n=1 Tax=Cinchona calisaya TaxID=153742 RepID=A0ABD2YQS4_9GENT